MDYKIPVGISSCLMGENVRYNGGHTQSKFCLNHLSKVFEFRRFCPEVAIGMGIPREPIRLVGDKESPRAVGTVNDSLDVTDQLHEYGVEIGEYSKQLSGYILMKNSPSCGLFSTKIYRDKHSIPGKHAGIFARALQKTNPLLPLEEEGRLNDPVLRENFIARVFALYDWQLSVGDEPTPDKLVKFHSRYKYVLMTHSQPVYKQLGQWVARAGIDDIQSLATRYIERFMETLKKPASRKGHANTLNHLVGYLKQEVSGDIRGELLGTIDEYRRGIVNLAVPVTMMNHYLKLYGSEYVQSQAYLEPYARDLGLRNTI